MQPQAPRFRRVLSFGDVLDESMQLYRGHWVTYALVSAVALIPPGLVVVWLSASGLMSSSFSLTDFEDGRLVQPVSLATQIGAIFTTSIVSIVFELVWFAAIVFTTELYLRGEQPKLSTVYARALRCFFTVLLGSIVFALGFIGLGIVGTVLLVVTVFGVIGSIVAVIALLFWWLRAGARKTWVKWLIILVTPYGLPLYFSIRWSMFAAAAIVERSGPLASLRRSSALVDQHVFRVLAILTMSSVIVGVMVYAPATLIEIPLFISSAARGQVGFNSTETTISNAVAIVLRILFASIGGIIYTLLFFDLRNRREGTDMVERLTQLEASPIEANG